MLLPFQVQVLAMWATARQWTSEAVVRMRDERGETTAGVILLVVLALSAAAIGAIIIDRMTSQAEKIPG